MLARAVVLIGVCFYLGCTGGPRAENPPQNSASQIPIAQSSTPWPTPGQEKRAYEYTEPADPDAICRDRNDEDRRLCIRIVTDIGLDLGFNFEGFTYISRAIDLNGDGRPEIVVRVPAPPHIGGTSGYPGFIYSRDGGELRKVMDEGGWTPIIRLGSRTKGWNDIAVQIGGGGAAWEFEIFRYNGKIYKHSRYQVKQPAGEILIEKDWAGSFFGPLPKN